MNTYDRICKRWLDITFALIGFLLTFWLFPLFAVLIRLDDPKGTVIFRQKRIGKNGVVFEMLKFRTMVMGAERTGSGVYSEKGDPRVTKVGAFLRASSLDELPQLLNILKGDMSLIGFRPPLTYHPWPFDAYTDEQKKMFRVRPGITGWAQVHGRKTTEWGERIRMNVWYSDHISFWLDLKIFLMTIAQVLTNRDNVNRGRTA